MAAESGEKRAARMRELEAKHAAMQAEHAAKALNYARVAEAIEKGNAGEHKVAALLDVLDGAGWVVLNDRYKSSTSRANIDHILVGPPGVCVIDSKNWKSGPVRFDDRGMAVGRYRRDQELAAAKGIADVVALRVRDVAVEVITGPVIVLAEAMGLTEPRFHHQVMLMQADWAIWRASTWSTPSRLSRPRRPDGAVTSRCRELRATFSLVRGHATTRCTTDNGSCRCETDGSSPRPERWPGPDHRATDEVAGAAEFSVVVAGLQHDDVVAVDEVHQAVLVVDPP